MSRSQPEPRQLNPDAAPQGDDYTVRRLAPADAAGVVDLIRRVYGRNYSYRPEFYHPDQVVRFNATGQLVSVVALDRAGAVVGHCAIMRPDLGPVAETGVSVVAPEHRAHHLMQRMRAVLYEEAPRLGLAGLYGEPVTNHVFSQKVYEAFGSHSCGVLLGMLPRSFENLAAPLPQRMSDVAYFKFLRPPAATVVHAPPGHRALVEQIYAQFAVPADYRPPGALGAGGTFSVSFTSAFQTGVIRVAEPGADVAAGIRDGRRALCGQLGAEAVYLELPLAQPGTPELCRRAEEEGFFFSGVAPLAFGDGDALRLQYLTRPIDPALVQLDNPFAREILAYAVAERKRLSRRDEGFQKG